MPSISNRPFNNVDSGWPRSVRLASGALALACILVYPLWRASSPEAATTTYTVTIENMKFSPNVVKMRLGDQVTFKNQDLFPHTVTKTGMIDSGMIKAGETWTFTAEKAGTIHYACSYHPVMEGTIEVEKP